MESFARVGAFDNNWCWKGVQPRGKDKKRGKREGERPEKKEKSRQIGYRRKDAEKGIYVVSHFLIVSAVWDLIGFQASSCLKTRGKMNEQNLFFFPKPS